MTTEVLGSVSFLEVPTVNGLGLILNSGGTPSILSDVTANRPAAGTAGRLFIDTTMHVMYRDNGGTWDALGSASTYTGTANQIDVTGSVLSISANAILPGTGGFVPPTGSTAQRPASPTSGLTRWNSTTSSAELYNGTYWLPQGQVLQVVTGTINAASGTTSIPYDSTTPLITEGTAIWSTTFTPLSATSRLLISFTLVNTNATVSNVNVCSLFVGATLAGATMDRAAANNAPSSMALHAVASPGSTAPITIQARFGGQGGTTWYVNQTNAASLGGASVTEYSIIEVL